jgi:hypothetical protein
LLCKFSSQKKADNAYKYLWDFDVDALNLDASLEYSKNMFSFLGQITLLSCQKDQSQLLIQFYRMPPGWKNNIEGEVNCKMDPM